MAAHVLVPVGRKGCRTKQPDWKTIFASYSDGLGVLRNLNLQRTITSKRFRAVPADRSPIP
jgi:NADPH-dependent 7-cyano-7-deazaguanine reductase QueF